MDWTAVAAEAVARFGTPCYVSAWEPVSDALSLLQALEGTVPVRHWLSLKTHPVAPLLRAWRDRGGGVEVISEYELGAALAEGMDADRIVVNGVAKHAWLSRFPVERLRVHLDSWMEISELGDLARRCRWRLGVRCHVTPERDPDDPPFLGQFGFMPDEAVQAVGSLRSQGLDVEGLHFHLGTNVRSIDAYRQALADLGCICRQANLTPQYVDCGGGLPVTSEHVYDQSPGDADLDLTELGNVLDRFAADLPSVREIWFENGRFLTSRSAVLVLRVLDVKDRPDCRYLICDAGRTNQAAVSAWESHDVLTIPERSGQSRLTTVCGPTCMMWDWIVRAPLPDDVRIGDCIVWLNAGAYHIPWESRFSHGLSQVIWRDERGKLSIARQREDFSHWWGSWK